MNKLSLFFNSLEKREKLIIIIGLYLFIFIVGIFGILLPLIDKKDELEKRIDKEFKNYYELIKLTEKYLTVKNRFLPVENLSLDLINELSEKARLKPTSVRKINENTYEIVLRNVSASQFIEFLKLIKKNNFSIKEMNINIDKGQIKKGKLVISDKI